MTHETEMLSVAEGDMIQHIEAAQQERLHEDVQRLGHHATIAKNVVASEKTPLLKAGKDVVAVDSDLDLVALDHDLQRQEEAVVLDDQRQQTSVIAREEAKGIFRLAIPMAGSQAVAVFPTILMGWFLGNAPGSDSAKVLAAGSLAGFLQGQLVFTIAGGVASALSTVCTQSFGAKQMSQICLYGQAGLVAAAYGVAFTSLVCVDGSHVFKWLGQDPELANLAGVFTMISTLSIPFVFMNEVAQSLLSSQHRVAPLVFVPILANLVTLPLAYVLGFHTRLSYIGVALADVVNSILTVAMVIPVLIKSPAFVDGWPGWRLKEAHAIAVTLLPLVGSSVLMVMSQSMGLSIISMMCGYLPNAAQAIAADNIASSLFSLAIVPLVGVGASGGIRVGTAIGAGKQRHASVGSYIAITVTVTVGAISALVSSAFAGSFSDGYTTDTATADLAAAVYPAQAALVVLLGWMFGIQSVLRACGEQSVIAKLNFLFLFVIGVPLGLTLAIPLQLGLIGLYLGEIVAMTGLNVTCSIYVSRFDWANVAHEAYANSHLHVEKEPESEPNA